MFKLIISSDRAIQQAQNVIFESSFMALHGVTYVTFSLYPIKIDMTEQSNYFIFFIAKLMLLFAIILTIFFGLFRTLNIILIFCIVGQILNVNQGHPPLKYNMSKSTFSLNETK